MELTRESLRMPNRIIAATALGAGYFLLAACSVSLTRFEGGTAFIWTASALLFGALLAADRRYWRERVLACAFGSFLATWLLSLGFVPGVILAFVNVAEALVAIHVFQWARKTFAGMGSIKDLGWLIVAAAIAAPLATSVPGAAAITAYSPVSFFENWLAWVSGHALGMLVFTPIVLLIVEGKVGEMLTQASRPKLGLGFVLHVILALVCAAVFSLDNLPLTFIPIPFIVLNTFLLGRLGSISSLLVVFVIATSLSIAGTGPIGSMSLPQADKSYMLQLFLASASLTAFLMAADLASRKSRYIDAKNEAALYSLALECSSDLIIECDARGDIRLASSSSQEILNVPADILVGGNIFDLIHPADELRVREMHEDLFLPHRKTIHMEFRLQGHGDRWGWFESHARRLPEGNGRKGGIVAVLREITERKAEENDLRTALAKAAA